MTVHAAKGLEFPVVFVVNLARGTGNRRDYIRIGTEQVSGAASVAVGDFMSEYDEDAQAREREETKRLLYVALTRARDRLYLSSVLKDGRIAPGRGSLAEVLPAALLDCFAAAAVGAPAEWRASSGQVHAFRVCGSEPGRLSPPTRRRRLSSPVPTTCSRFTTRVPSGWPPIRRPRPGRCSTRAPRRWNPTARSAPWCIV